MRQHTSLPFIQKPAGTPWNGTIGNWDATSKVKTLIVLHTMEGSLTGTDAEFADPNHKHAANYGIGLNGEKHLYVPEDLTAYHCGKYATNQVSIGIEHEDKTNFNDSVRTPEMYQSSAELVADICKAWGIPCDRDHIRKHNEITATTCPGGLDVDKIISMAQVLLRQQTEPKPESQAMTPDEQNALSVLKEAFTTLKTRSGAQFGNLEGLVRALAPVYTDYLNLTKADSTGKPPVVVSQDHFVDINVKAQNFDKVAAYFGYTELNEVDPALGTKIVDNIRLLSQGSNSLENVIASPGTATATPPKDGQMTVSLTGSPNLLAAIFGKLSGLYASLFLTKEVTK